MGNNRLKQGLREVDRAVIQAVMFEEGILPMERTDLDMRRALQQLPPDEARVMRRKFRKAWRSAMRVSLANDKTMTSRSPAVSSAAELTKRKLGVGKQVPSRAERNARKQLVFDHLWSSTIEPMIKAFENPLQKQEIIPGAKKVRRRKKTKNGT